MFKILNRVYDQVKDNSIISKGTEMVSIAREVYSLVQKDRSPSIAAKTPLYENVESLYIEAVTNVTGETSKEQLRGRWDVWTVQQGAQRTRSIRRKSKEFAKRGRGHVLRAAGRVRKLAVVKKCVSVGKAVMVRSENIKIEVATFVRKRAKTCENKGRAVLKTVTNVRNRIRKQVKKGIRFGRKSVEKVSRSVRENLKFAKLRLKNVSDKYVRPRIDPVVKQIVQKLAKANESLETSWKQFKLSTQNTFNDRRQKIAELIEQLSTALQTQLKQTANLLIQKSSTVIKPVAAKITPYIQNSQDFISEKTKPVTDVVTANWQSVRNLVDFTWVVIKAMAQENKQFVEGYLQDVDWEVHYAAGKSFSFREQAVSGWKRISCGKPEREETLEIQEMEDLRELEEQHREDSEEVEEHVEFQQPVREESEDYSESESEDPELLKNNVFAKLAN